MEFRWTIPAQQAPVGILEVYDGNVLGGSAALSFEVLDDNTSQRITLVSSAQLGTVSFGTLISKQIGDVINDLANDKFNIALPSTQTNFRAKLVVTGNLNIRVSILKVS